MELTAEQTADLRLWVGEGESLSKIQDLLKEKYGLGLTYMDVRFLVDDLDLEMADKPAHEPTPDLSKAPPAPTPEAADLGGAPAGVSVEVDKVVRPGAVVSGSATFSDGVSVTWMIDQMGRLAMDGATPDYRPSPDDLQDFQMQLQAALQKQGF